jgi:hypothetical protein
MGMDIDEAGRHDFAAGIDFLPARPIERADGCDDAILDGNVTDKGIVGTGTIDNRAIADHKVKFSAHYASPRLVHLILAKRSATSNCLSTTLKIVAEYLPLI